MNNYKSSSNKGHFLLIVCLILIFSSLSFSGGYFLGTWGEYNDSDKAVIEKEIIKEADDKITQTDKNIDFKTFWEVWDSIKKNHVDQPVDESKMFYGALSGMVSSLEDPHSVFLDPELTKTFNDDINGTFEGIGAEIGKKDNRIVIVAPLADSPAEQAGLKAGDIILTVDDVDTYDMAIDYAVQLIRGEKGTEVKFLVQRENEEDAEFSVTRDVIKYESVKWEIKEQAGKKIGYIELINFNNDIIKKFNEATSEILLEQPDGLILDLRNNPGGVLDESVKISSVFIEDGVVVYEESKEGERKEYKANGSARLNNLPIVVLVNQGSASASEIVAGALQDYGLATLVGQTTFGKGSVQYLENFSDGSGLKLTVAHWLTPSGRLIEGEGIAPDIEVEFTKEDYEADADPQLDKALEILSK